MACQDTFVAFHPCPLYSFGVGSSHHILVHVLTLPERPTQEISRLGSRPKYTNVFIVRMSILVCSSSARDHALAAPQQRRRLLFVCVFRHYRLVEALLADAAREDELPLAFRPPAFEASRVDRPILRPRASDEWQCFGRCRGWLRGMVGAAVVW